MLFSLVITGAAGWYLSIALKEKKTVQVPLTRVATPTPSQPTPSPKPSPTASAASNMPLTVAAKMPGAEAKSESSPDDSEKRKILFSLRSAKARKVYIVGSFNKWFRQPMTKKGNVWSATVELGPGTYEYKFVVDNKRIKDPSNSASSKAGNSVLTVKPSSDS